MIDIDELMRKAKENDSEEFIISVERNDNYNLAVGVRMLKRNGKTEIFTAASIKLGIMDNCSIDLDQLIRATGELYAFKESGYCLCYGGDGTVYVERETTREEVEGQIAKMKQMLENSH